MFRTLTRRRAGRAFPVLRIRPGRTPAVNAKPKAVAKKPAKPAAEPVSATNDNLNPASCRWPTA